MLIFTCCAGINGLLVIYYEKIVYNHYFLERSVFQINEVIEEAQSEAVDTDLDQYIVADTNRNIINFANYLELSEENWVIGKVSLVYKDKMLEAKYVEYPNLIRFVCMYKKIQIIEIIVGDKKQYSFTILKNKSGDNQKILFKSVKEVKEYISSFDKYSEKDRIWFLTK